MIEDFRNEPLVDFGREENRRKMLETLAYVESQFSREYPLFIDGREVRSERRFKSYNPANKDQVVGTFHMAGKAEVDLAMTAALAAFEKWRHVDPQERATVLLKAARILRERKLEVSAWMVMEASKNWVEADADTAEAIDFLEFYAREMLRYSARQPLSPIHGEFNSLVYVPLGVGVILPPWNFPMAILTGMTAAAIVTGNAVLLKPASDTPVIGHKLLEIMQEAGLPPGVLNFVPGSGGEIGDYLVTHPKTRFIGFTGSMEVGLRINELAAKKSAGQIWIKRVIAEMGGKDGIIVDREADLDAAAEGTIVSAFGYQGQKCSACSRVIVEASIYDTFCDLLVERAKRITVGPPKDPINYMGAVINAAAAEKIMSYIDVGYREGKLLFGGSRVAGNGHFLQPTIFRDIAPEARLAQEEIFGPVLAVIKAQDFDDALRIANGTVFGLTGSVYTQNREKIQRAKKEFFVGNLYINRKSTGALVGGNPFGGFNMSGTDSKAGGRDYLLLFLQAKSISELL